MNILVKSVLFPPFSALDPNQAITIAALLP